MKKILIPVLFVLLLVAGYFSFQDSKSKPGDIATHSHRAASSDNTQATRASGKIGGEEDPEYDERPAAQVYSSSNEAYDAILKASKDYDDIVLERFTQPGADCTWCDDLYTRLTQKMLAADASEDEKSFIGEILAISGRAKNVQTLIEAVQQAGESDDADIFSESLELTIGGDDVVELLKQHLNSSNELLQEAVVAAVTNQGSKFAAETLYTHTVEKGDVDGYYALGIGLGEFIPDEEAMPYLSSLVKKRDGYSHLAVKALLNGGAEGVKYVLDELANSSNPEADRKMLVDASDHLAYDEETIAILRRCKDTNSSALAKEFCTQNLTELEQEEADLKELDDELDEE